MKFSVDWEFVGSMFSVKELTQDVTRGRKLIFLAGYFLCVSVLVSFLYLLGDSRKDFLVHFGKYGTALVVLYFFCLQPIFLLVQTIVFKLPKVDENDVVAVDENERGNPDIGVIILCQGCESIVEAVKSSLEHFCVNQVFVIQHSPNPNDRAIVDSELEGERLSGRVHHVFIPQCNKTLAIHTGAVAAREYAKVLVMDANMKLPAPPRLQFDRRLFRKNVKAVAYPCRLLCNDESENEARRKNW